VGKRLCCKVQFFFVVKVRLFVSLKQVFEVGVAGNVIAALRSSRLDAQIFKLKQMFNRVTNLEATTEPAI
jgi:hypothetical protein